MNKKDFGMIGLGVMGQNFALNVERNGFGVAVFDINPRVVTRFAEEKAAGKKVQPTFSLAEFVRCLEKPRRIMLLVPAGKPVDSVISKLAPLLDKDDLIIDGGNSYFLDTERRARLLLVRGLRLLGMGVSGGEEGALRGPSLMPGGTEEAYGLVEPLLTRVSAKAQEDGDPCVAYIGPGGSGHFVKMVHNGIEYGDMQLISEAYHLLKRTLDLPAQDFHEIFSEWNETELSSFLIEITAEVFKKIDGDTGEPLIDVILDTAGQKGTGKWTSQIALEMGAAVPTITAAVDARILSFLKKERVQASKFLTGPVGLKSSSSSKTLIDSVRDALYASKICLYAQGMRMLTSSSETYNYHLKLDEIAKIWRAGCIIRARLLNDIARAYRHDPGLPNLLLDQHFRKAIRERQEPWRRTLMTAIELGVPMPAMSASLAYYDAYRSERLPANLIQAQRDFFGAHTFERVDRAGVFHANWKEGDSLEDISLRLPGVRPALV